MPKRGKSVKEFNILRALVIIAVVVYILGIVPQFTAGIRALFQNPLMKVAFLGLIVFAGYMDSTIGTLLAVAFLVSYLATPDYKGNPVYDVLSDVRTGTGRVVRGVGSGAQQVVGGLGSGASQLVGGVGSGAQQVVGGVQTGASRLVSGVGSGAKQFLGGAQNLVGGVEGGVQGVLGGVGSGAQYLIGGAQSGTQQALSGIQSGTQQVVGGLQYGAQKLLGGVENLENAPLSVSQAYQQHMNSENQGDKGCNVQPMMSTGCDPIVGYNAPYNCGCSGACGGKCEGLDPACLCKGVKVWEDELGAQGLTFPQGYAGCQVGSTY